jgi:hypothetical protein
MLFEFVFAVLLEVHRVTFRGGQRSNFSSRKCSQVTSMSCLLEGFQNCDERGEVEGCRRLFVLRRGLAFAALFLL